MMLHQDGSRHAWLADAPELDLIVTMDDATSKIYSAFLVEEDGTASSFQSLLETFAAKGLSSSLYTDRGSHYPHAQGRGQGDKVRLTQVGRALQRLGIEHTPAYSPEARGRSERMFSTLQQRLPRELALAGIRDIAAANRFIADNYLPLIMPASPDRPRSPTAPRCRRSGPIGRDPVRRRGARRRPRQHHRLRPAETAIAAKSDPTPFRQGQRQGPPLPGRQNGRVPRPAPDRMVHCRRRTSRTEAQKCCVNRFDAKTGADR
ncbi:hypothetical protein [Mesorhizobium sp. WSM3873]|uniref:hypothetical protein n=1 Tax=Mesorhizobium sp. WSM3873 TaxID=1854056 RepID=UPI0018D3FDC9|nr:hypothetical protein [Mesorhizobium sp. WSM3873]